MTAHGHLDKITPPRDLDDDEKNSFFQHFFRRLAAYRNQAMLYSILEVSMEATDPDELTAKQSEFESLINGWAQGLLENAWRVVHGEKSVAECPHLDPLADTATGDIGLLPSAERLTRILSAILFLELTTSKTYSAHTRTFLMSFGEVDEGTIVDTLKHPELALEEAQKLAEQLKKEHEKKGRTWRMVGVGLGAVAGGVIVGVTGGLAAPLVGAGVATVLTWLGLGGTLIGILASGLAGSAVVCGALFGVYGASSTADKVRRHTREVRDLAIVSLDDKRKGYDNLSVRLCVSGWVDDVKDVTAPWELVEGQDTFALQWEIEALQELSNALTALIKSEAMKFAKVQILRRTVLAGLLNSMAPLALLRIGQIIDNPWMNARALALRTGAVLGELIAAKAVGNRPITLVGYSLGSLVILEALKYLATLPPSKTLHLVQDVFLFGIPAPADPTAWTSVRRVVAGRIVNGYSSSDLVLAVLSRTSDATWSIAGMEEVHVKGIENFECEDLGGHAQWRWKVGEYLERIDGHHRDMVT